MKNYFSILSIFLVLIATSCSEPPAENEAKAEPKKEKPPVKKELADREPDVKAYLDEMEVIVDEYITVGETLMENYEANTTTELALDDQMKAMMTMFETAGKIAKLSGDLSELEETRSKIVEKLDGDDVAQFAVLVASKMERVTELMGRIGDAEILEKAGF